MAAPYEWLDDWDGNLVAKEPLRVIGIDLGTTNSTITETIWSPEGGERAVAEVVEVAQKTSSGELFSELVPSAVARVGDETYVGEGAYRLRGQDDLTRNRDIFWSSKNEIGTRRQYVRAPEDFKTPKDIATHILRFLREAAEDHAPRPIDRVVITVPASFQWTQRQDTLEAARAAGLDVEPGDLLDEPVAAFLDYLTVNGHESLRGLKRIMVLDFGGGTCDVALLKINFDNDQFEFAPEAVSRFHRIGGSDIDEQIAYKYLYPRLLKDNGAQNRRFSYSQKRDHILPALSALASQLKMKLSEKVRRNRALKARDSDDPDSQVSLPGTHKIPTGAEGKELELKSPSLTYDQLTRATRRFVSRVLLAPESDEYSTAMSVFAPVTDALERCDLDTEDVDAVLLVGGSSLLPTFVDAVAKHFETASILEYGGESNALRCVGRGAAAHALMLAAYERPPLRPTTGDSLSLRVQDGTARLIDRNQELPISSGDSGIDESLNLPDGDGSGPILLRLELVSGAEADDGGRLLHTEMVQVDSPAKAGDPIGLAIEVDENQYVRLTATVTSGSSEQQFEMKLENPFVVVENPGKDRERLLELEEVAVLMSGREKLKAFREIADLHNKLGDREQAREMYEKLATRLQGDSAKASIHNALGGLCGELRDYEAQVEHYEESARLGWGDTALINLALKQWIRDDNEGALKSINRAITIREEPSSLAFKAKILEELYEEDDAHRLRQRAVDKAVKAGLDTHYVFELHWIKDAATALELEDVLREISEIDKRRGADKAAGKKPKAAVGELPIRGK